MTEEKILIPEAVFPISKKRLMMQYLRWLPAKFGLISKTAFLFQIKKINPDDVFLVSYPKSGNTWLRFILAYLKNGTSTTINFHQLENIVPDVYVSKDIIDTQKSGRIIKTHDIFFEGYPRVIYIHRDYRDALISYYYFVLAYKFFDGTFSEFIRSNIVLRHGSWKQHIKAMKKYKQENPDKILVLSYESLLNNFDKSVESINRFCGFKKEVDLNKLKEKTSFSELKKIENEFGSRFMSNTKQNFVREGKSGGWKDFYSKEDLDFLYSDKELVSLMNELGYSV